MPEPTSTFPRFTYLPSEIREQIWIQALPGPRIVYIQRLLESGQNSYWAWFDDTLNFPLASYFTSSSPGDSILSLLYVCKESSAVVRTRYERILPESDTDTWFDFEKDFLYVDWGRRYKTVPYAPETFDPSSVGDLWGPSHINRYASPRIYKDMASRVKNLAIYECHWRRNEEEWLVRNVLGVFSGVQVLVMADQLHDSFESGEELVWIHTWAPFEVEGNQSERQVEDSLLWKSSILWEDYTQYGFCVDLDHKKFRIEWDKYRPGQQIPKIFKNSITTARAKQILLDICGSEDNFRVLKSLNWDFVTGDKNVSGLSLSQQIKYLQLALENISGNPELDEQGCYMQGGNVTNIWILGPKIDKLMFEREIEELVLAEAEEIAWE